MSSATLTIRVEEGLKHRLEKLAQATLRSKSFLAAQALEDFVALQEWQVTEIKKGLIEADAGELISHEAILKKWKKRNAGTVD
jgi:RHH-type rel operon transcriptional repressor/antitoxin RelB